MTNSIPDGTTKWVRATQSVNNGSGGTDIKFYTSDDGTAWTQFGATVTVAGVTSIYPSTQILQDQQSNAYKAGKIYDLQVFNGINGTKVLDIDTSVITSGSATSFTALTGQNVVIQRAATGRKTAVVVSPEWLFGTNNFMTIPNNALLDFGASQDFTIITVSRGFGAPVYNAIISKKGGGGSGVGWYTIMDSSSSGRRYIETGNGTTSVVASKASTPFGGVDISGYTRSGSTITNYYGGVSGTTNTMGSDLSNSYNVFIGKGGDGANIADMELYAVAVFRRALAPSEISAITTYYGSQVS